MPLYGWTKQWAFDRKSWNLSKLGYAPFPEVNAATFDLYFHDRDSDNDYGHGYKGNFKATFFSPEVAQ